MVPKTFDKCVTATNFVLSLINDSKWSKSKSPFLSILINFKLIPWLSRSKNQGSKLE